MPGSHNRGAIWNEKIRFIPGANGKSMTTGEILAKMPSWTYSTTLIA
jgi:hypothetical protein